MIIQCPNCSQRISDKHPTCPHCQLDLASSGEGLSYSEAQKRRQRLWKGRIEMHAYASILLTVAGATWMYFSSDQLSETPGTWPTATLVVGAAWYLGVRIYTIFARNRR